MSDTLSDVHTEGAGTQNTKKWFFRNFPSTDAVLQFVNGAPAQVAGEISATARNDGSVGLFYFSTQQ